ncbi:MAG: hypothetical protein HC811_12575 [Flammeovirgaceae bacterium]|nr:hypothetical protein [Flammeovirgaceae bacterium]
MAKIIKFPHPTPEKFGFKPVRKRRSAKKDKHGQLNLFAGGKLVKLSQLSSFEEGLVLDEEMMPGPLKLISVPLRKAIVCRMHIVILV